MTEGSEVPLPQGPFHGGWGDEQVYEKKVSHTGQRIYDVSNGTTRMWYAEPASFRNPSISGSLTAPGIDLLVSATSRGIVVIDVSGGRCTDIMQPDEFERKMKDKKYPSMDMTQAQHALNENPVTIKAVKDALAKGIELLTHVETSEHSADVPKKFMNQKNLMEQKLASLNL